MRFLYQQYLLSYWHWFLGGVAFLFATNWLGTNIPLVLARTLDGMKQGKPTSFLVSSALLMVGMGFAVIGVRTLSRLLFFTPGRDMEYRIKNDLFAHLLKLQPSFYSRWELGDIISRSSNDITSVRAMVGFGGLQIINIITAVSLTLYQMIHLSWKLTLATLSPVIIGFFIVQLGIRNIFALSKESQERLSMISSSIFSSLQGIQTIQGFQAEESFLKRFQERNESYLETNMKLANIRVFIMPCLGLAGAIGIWLLLYVGGRMVIENTITVGQLVAFLSLLAYILVPLRSLGFLLSLYQRFQSGMERIVELFQEVPENPEGTEPTVVDFSNGVEVECRKLTFAYPDAPEKNVLEKVSISIPQGQKVGIFGKTGSGKTTLLRVLSRLYNPPADTVFVNKVNIRDVSLEQLREMLTLIPQVPFLFSESIQKNLDMALLGKQQTQEFWDEVLEKAQLAEEITRFPDGVETIVGERGIMLSGGQRQRVTLARALAKKTTLLLLDDVLSAVDHHTEQKLIEMLKVEHETHQMTFVIASHRMSVLSQMDKVIVLDQGMIQDQGTHQELLQKEGLYRDAWLAHEESEKELQS